jgi:hypothetical protein
LRAGTYYPLGSFSASEGSKVLDKLRDFPMSESCLELIEVKSVHPCRQVVPISSAQVKRIEVTKNKDFY